MKKIIFVAGELNTVSSYEYQNFVKPLESLGYEVIQFDFIRHYREMGKTNMNNLLVEIVRNESPQLVFFIPITDQIIKEVIIEINKYAITLGYFYDDMWRVNYARYWTKYFNFITTSDINGLQKYKEAGITNVIYSPFACNPEVYSNMNLDKIYDITFIGEYHPQREWYINNLIKAGYNVQVWGNGWPKGRITHEHMVKIFNQSRINLNLSNSAFWDSRYLFTFKRSLKKTLNVWIDNYRATYASDRKTTEQIKARHFEINSCGGFQLSYYVEGLEKLYEIGNEITIFTSIEDLLYKVHFYLTNEAEREIVAKSGYNRTIKDHSTMQRLKSLLSNINL